MNLFTTGKQKRHTVISAFDKQDDISFLKLYALEFFSPLFYFQPQKFTFDVYFNSLLRQVAFSFIMSSYRVFYPRKLNILYPRGIYAFFGVNAR